MKLALFTLLCCCTLGGLGLASAIAQEPKGEEHAPKGERNLQGPADHAEAAQASKGGEHAGEHGDAAKGGTEHEAGHPPHDDTDLSHGDGSPQLKAAQELRFDLGIATFLVFLILLAILTKFAWGPILAGLAKREETIAQQIAEAKMAAETAGKQLAEYERKLAAATEEARAIVGQARADAETAKDKIVAEAKEAAGRERERAVADIASAKNDALREIAAKSVSTAVTLASNIIRREVKPEDHDKLISDSLQQFSKLN
jgi:F-type H+-transporting ATPase subunit b